MIGMCRYTLIIGHKFCTMFGLRNALTLFKELQNVMKITTTTTTTQLIKQTNKNPCQTWISNTGYLAPQSRATCRASSQLNISIAVKLDHCFNVIGRNINKQSQAILFQRSHFSAIS